MTTRTSGIGDGPRAQLEWMLARLAPAIGLNRDAVLYLSRVAEFRRSAGDQSVRDGRRCTTFVGFSLSAVLKVVCRSGDHDPMTVRFVAPGSFICLPAHRPAGCEVAMTVHEAGMLALFSYRDFRRAVASLGDNAARLASWTFRTLSADIYRKVSLLRLSVIDRLVYELPTLARELPRPMEDGTGTEIATRLLHDDVAEVIGSTRSSVSRAMGLLCDLDLITQPSFGRVVVLSALLNADPAAVTRRIAREIAARHNDPNLT